MTETDDHEVPARPHHDRMLAECCCPAGCGGRPEAMRKLPPAYPKVSEFGRTPPDFPYSPTVQGELVYDTLNDRTGCFMGRLGALVYLRPLGGGYEWDVDQRWLLAGTPDGSRR